MNRGELMQRLSRCMGNLDMRYPMQEVTSAELAEVLRPLIGPTDSTDGPSIEIADYIGYHRTVIGVRR